MAEILKLSAQDREEMIHCLAVELLNEQGARVKIDSDGQTYLAKPMTNGWVAVFRKDGVRFVKETIVVFDLISPDTSLYSGRDLGISD
jgi:hypothetical protein